jgi:signal transduction histidine kinase
VGIPSSIGAWLSKHVRRTPEPVVLFAKAAVLGSLYALGALLPFWFLDSPEAGAAFFPAAGLTLSALVLSPRRTWPLWLATVAIAEVAVDLTHGQSIAMAIGFALANIIEPLIGAAGIRRFAKFPPVNLHQNPMVYFGWGMVVGPLVGGLVGASTAVVVGDATGWFSIAAKWWLGDALGVLVVATPILAWTTKPRYEATCGPAETAAIVILATGVTVVPSVLWQHPMLYALLPILVWAALRGGSRAVSAAGIGIAFAANWAAVTGRSDELIVGGRDVVFVQLFLVVTLLAALVLAVEVADRRRVEDAVRRAETRRAEAERAMVETVELERRRIARETHDIVGHALNVMLLQAGAARRMLGRDDRVTREFLESIEVVGRDAFRDLDVALAAQARCSDLTPARGLDDVADLVETMRKAGIDVTLDVTGENRELATIVDWSTFRIVQEALTNVTKHAPGARASVTIEFKPDEVALTVVSRRDDGATSRAGPEGRGLIGMRERVTVLGGEFAAGSEPDAFVVRARLPRAPAPLPREE